MDESRITIRIDNQLHEELAEAARSRGQTESEVVREAIRRAVKPRKAKKEKVVSAYDLLKKSKLIGIIKGGPRDLSTNPKYMKGFGE
jgi:metal-responsive CopG/Arc/MetJ family transcriptional regulator